MPRRQGGEGGREGKLGVGEERREERRNQEKKNELRNKKRRKLVYQIREKKTLKGREYAEEKGTQPSKHPLHLKRIRRGKIRKKTKELIQRDREKKILKKFGFHISCEGEKVSKERYKKGGNPWRNRLGFLFLLPPCDTEEV